MVQYNGMLMFTLALSVSTLMVSCQPMDKNISFIIPEKEVYAGDDTSLPCNSKVTWHIFNTVTWMKQIGNKTHKLAIKKDGIVEDLTKRGYGFVGPTDLFIPTLTSNDTGLFLCEVQNGHQGTLSTTSVILEVTVLCWLPKFQPQLESTNCDAGNSVMEGGTCFFMCKSGYTLIGSHELVCLSNRSFSGPLPGCYQIPIFQAYVGDDAALPCTNLTHLENEDTLYWKRIDENTTHTLLTKTNEKTTTWGERGLCVMNNTFLLIPIVTKEDTAIYQCKIMKKSSVKIYSRNTTFVVKERCFWPKHSPELQIFPKSCDDDFIVEGKNCSFKCKEGYQITKNKTVTCLPDGRLSDSLPTCRVVNCTIYIPGIHPHPEMERCQQNTSIAFGTACYFSCGSQYQLVNGDKVRTCQANATLSGKAGICKISPKSTVFIVLVSITCPLLIVVTIILFFRHRSSYWQLSPESSVSQQTPGNE